MPTPGAPHIATWLVWADGYWYGMGVQIVLSFWLALKFWLLASIAGPQVCASEALCACARAKPSSVPQCAGASEGDRSWKGAGDAPFHCVQYGFIIYIYIYIYIVSIVLYIHKYKRCLSGTRCVHS